MFTNMRWSAIEDIAAPPVSKMTDMDRVCVNATDGLRIASGGQDPISTDFILQVRTLYSITLICDYRTIFAKDVDLDYRECL